MKRYIFILAVAVMLCGVASAGVVLNGNNAKANVLENKNYDWLLEGERLKYSVHWGWFKIGDAELMYKPEATNYNIVARAWTNSNLFKMKERLSVTGQNLQEKNNPQFLPNTYQQMQVENDFKANKIVTFDHATKQATYDNKRDRVAPEVFDISPVARDMLSALYYLRQMADLNSAIPELPVVSLHRKYNMQVKIGKPQTIDFKNETVAVRKISPIFIAPDGSTKIKENWTIWITDDGQRLPIKINMASKFGTFKAVLKDFGNINIKSEAMVPEKGDF